MRILQISDTHNRHQLLADLPAADVLVHCGDFTDMGTEQEVLDFLNWLIEMPYPYKLFVTGNHDLCLWDAENIEELPQNIYFLQDRGCEIGNVKFFGLGYNHQESLIPTDVDILITHEPPMMILDKSSDRHWGNLPLRNRVMEVRPQYHLFGHAHESYGIVQTGTTIFSNGSVMDNLYQLCHAPRLIEL